MGSVPWKKLKLEQHKKIEKVWKIRVRRLERCSITMVVTEQWKFMTRFKKGEKVAKKYLGEEHFRQRKQLPTQAIRQ